MTVLYMYIMYIQCIILSFCISLSISFFMYIFIDFVLLLYLKSKSKWIIINRVYKNYVCNTSNSHRLFLYMNLLEKFRTWYNNLDNCTTVNQNMQNKKKMKGLVDPVSWLFPLLYDEWHSFVTSECSNDINASNNLFKKAILSLSMFFIINYYSVLIWFLCQTWSFTRLTKQKDEENEHD